MFGLKRIPCIISFICLMIFAHHQEVQAQPSSYLYIHSTDEVMSDLNVIVDKIAGELKAWNNKVKPNIEIFLGGIETDKPLLFEIQLDLDNTKYISSFPVGAANEKNFLNNLNGLGVKSRPQGSMYQLRSAFEGFLVFNNNYAHISSDKKDLDKDKLHDVSKLGAKFIDKKSEIAYWIHNDQDKMEERKKSFSGFTQKILSNIPDRPKLSKEENVLAKLGIQQQLEELQRYFVESKTVELDWTTHAPKLTGDGFLLFEALPGTSLEESLKLVSKEPSLYQKVSPVSGGTVSGRIFFPIDEFRKKQLVDFYNAFRPVIKQRLDTVKMLNADQKQASKEAMDLLIDMLSASTKMDNLDSFLEMIPGENGLQKIITSSRMIDSSKVKPFLEKLIKIDTKATLNADKVTIAGVKFDELILRENVPVGLQKLFGKSPRILVGTQVKEDGKVEQVWVALGNNTDDDLKRSLEQTAGPRDPLGDKTTLISWVSSLAVVMAALDAELLENERKDENRAVLVKSLNEKDGKVDLQLYLEKNQVKGNLTVDEGILRAFGKILAEVSKSL